MRIYRTLATEIIAAHSVLARSTLLTSFPSRFATLRTPDTLERGQFPRSQAIPHGLLTKGGSHGPDHDEKAYTLGAILGANFYQEES